LINHAPEVQEDGGVILILSETIAMLALNHQVLSGIIDQRKIDPFASRSFGHRHLGRRLYGVIPGRMTNKDVEFAIALGLNLSVLAEARANALRNLTSQWPNDANFGQSAKNDYSQNIVSRVEPMMTSTGPRFTGRLEKPAV
jgi:hypothetical protein